MPGGSMDDARVITAEPPRTQAFLSPIGMLSNLLTYRQLIGQLTRRELEGQYRGSYLGIIWAVINPLMSLAVYSFVFGLIFKSRFGAGEDGGTAMFVLNLFCGLILYALFSNTVARAPELIVGNRNYVKRVVFPLEVLPITVLGSNLVNAAMSLVILIAALVVLCGSFSSTIWLFPLVLVPHCALILGLSWFLASLGVFLRDVGQVVGVALQLLLFASPVLYPLSFVPERFQLIVRLNPLVTILENSRRTLISGQFPEWGWLIATTVMSLALLQFGYIWFMKSKRVFADVL